MQKSLKKEWHEISNRNKTQEEIEKSEVVRLDRAKEKIFKWNKCKKLWRQKVH